MLIHNKLFRSVLIASCMLAGPIPPVIPTKVNEPNDSDSSSASADTSTIKLSNESTRRQRKRKRYRTVVDSGASIHCIRDRSLFTYLDVTKSVRVKVANNHVINSAGVGTCAIKVKSSIGETHTIVLQNCVYSPQFSDNLISTRRLWRDSKISTHLGGINYLKCHETGSRYHFADDCTHSVEATARKVGISEIDMNLVHARFYHCHGKHRMRKMFLM